MYFPHYRLATPTFPPNAIFIPQSSPRENLPDLPQMNPCSIPIQTLPTGGFGGDEDFGLQENFSPRDHLEMLPPSFYQTYEETINKLNVLSFQITR